MVVGDPEPPSDSDSDSEDDGEDSNDGAANSRPDIVLRPGLGQEDPQATAANLEGGHGPAIQAWHLCVLVCRLHHFMPWFTAACCRVSVQDTASSTPQPAPSTAGWQQITRSFVFTVVLVSERLKLHLMVPGVLHGLETRDRADVADVPRGAMHNVELHGFQKRSLA